MAFKQILRKFLPVSCMFSYTMMTEKLVGTKPLNTKHSLERLSSSIIFHNPPKHLWTTIGMEENPTQQPEIHLFLQFTSSAIKSVNSFLSSSNFHLITLYQLHLQLQSLPLYHLFNFRFYVHTCHASFNYSRFTECCLQHDKSIEQSKFSQKNVYFPHLFQLTPLQLGVHAL